MRWQDKVCCVCGLGSKVYIEILIALPDESEYPYTQTALCKECWDEYGIEVALEHNKTFQE